MKKYLLAGLLVVVCLFTLSSEKVYAAYSVNTDPATGFSGTGGMTLNGDIVSPPGTASVGFYYGTSTSAGLATVSAGTMSSTGPFSKMLGVDNCGVTYYFKAFSTIATTGTSTGTSTSGTITGGFRSVTTICPPVVNNVSVTGVTSNSAVLTGNVMNTNGATITSRGFRYGLASSTTLTLTSLESGSFGVGNFSRTVTGLMCNTNYQFQARATNFSGIGYGYYVIFFKTLACSGGSGSSTTSASSLSATSKTTPGASNQVKKAVPVTPAQNSTIQTKLGGNAIGAFENIENSTTSKYSFTQNMTYGSTGSDVSALQKVLSEKGYLSVSELGDFYGLATMNAVKKFQTASGLDAVGVVGPKTLELLNK